MFNQKEIETYRSISAPTNLRSRVLATVENPSKKPAFTLGVRTTWGLAACLVLVMVVFTTAPLRDTSVIISGTPILAKHSFFIEPEYDVVPLRMQQPQEDITSSVAFSITFNFPKETKVSVSSGEMRLTLNDTVSSGTAFTIKDKTTIVWYVTPNDSDNAFVMTLNSASKSETLILDYEETDENWTISRQVNH